MLVRARGAPIHVPAYPVKVQRRVGRGRHGGGVARA